MSSTETFVPPRFRPLPERVAGLRKPAMKLDGVWRINPAPPAGSQTKSIADWSPLNVPGQWLQQGFDVPRDRTVAIAKDFSLPTAWSGNRIILRFEAVHGGADYWLNGHHLGYSENLATPVEFDITDAALPGRMNHLALGVKVQTPSEIASFMCDYAFHSLGGIDRSVYLFALPPVHFTSCHYTTKFDQQYRSETMEIDLRFAVPPGAPLSGYAIRPTLETLAGERVETMPSAYEFVDVQPGNQRWQALVVVKNPLMWSAEKPNLYRLKVGLYRAGKLIEEIEKTVGFRQIAVRDRKLWINGRAVKLAGINRHETDPLTGRAATAVHAEEDARLLREANFNFVRTSHYPPTREFLDACDRLGLYVEVEAPFCWTRSGHGEDDPAQRDRFLTPTAAMVDFCRDHPSVIIWSLANESGTGPDGENKLRPNFAATHDFVKKADPTRPILFNNEWNKDGRACDIAVLHYPGLPLDGNTFVAGDPRPVQLDEYFPPMAWANVEQVKLDPGTRIEWSQGQNKPGSLWNTVYECPYICGGAIWAGIDEEFYFRDGSVRGYGPWGFLDVWRRKKGEFWDAQRIHSPVWIPVRRVDYKPGQRTVRVPIENRYSFTDLSELTCEWQIGNAKGPLRLSLAPQTKGELEVPVLERTAEGTMLVLRFTDAHGTLVTAHGVTLGEAAHPKPETPHAGCPTWHDDGKRIEVSGKHYRLVLDKATGAIVPGASTMKLLCFPTLHVARREEKMVFTPTAPAYAEFPDAKTRVIESVTAEPRGQALAIRIRDRYADYAGTVELLLDDEGNADATYDYAFTGEGFLVKEIGLRLRMDHSCQEIRWRRQSEWDVYPDDNIGRAIGTAHAMPPGRLAKNGPPPYKTRPTWPWSLDANEFGTTDFRATKYGIYEASLVAQDGSGVAALSDGADNARACLAPDAVLLHVVDGSVTVKPADGTVLAPHARLESGERVKGTFHLRLLGANR